MGLVVVVASCGSGAVSEGTGIAPAGSAPESTGTSVSSSAEDRGLAGERVENAPLPDSGSGEQPGSDAGTPLDEATLEELWLVVDRTIALPRMSFVLDVTMTLPGSVSPVVARRTGGFDDETFSGAGTRSFHTDDPVLADVVGAEPFEFRFIGETLWMYNPLSDPAAWRGFDVFEFAELAGGNPLGSVDGDLFVGQVAAATTEVLGVDKQTDGSAVWLLTVRADDLVPVVAAAGPASRLIDAGAGQSGLVVELQMYQSSEGHFEGFTAQLDDWWSRAIALGIDSAESDQSMSVEFRSEVFSAPLVPEPPCTNTVTTIDDTGFSALICDS